jgi:hypothetical protein
LNFCLDERPVEEGGCCGNIKLKVSSKLTKSSGGGEKMGEEDGGRLQLGGHGRVWHEQHVFQKCGSKLSEMQRTGGGGSLLLLLR